MDVRCEQCGAEYDFDDERVGTTGITVKCTACSHVFRVLRRGNPIQNVGKRSCDPEWLVRRPDNQLIAFQDLTTLQKWIVEGRIERRDRISRDGEKWKELGTITELDPFFSVYEKAQHYNTLLESGRVSGPPVKLRGTEVLESMDPLRNIDVDEDALTPRPYLEPPPAALPAELSMPDHRRGVDSVVSNELEANAWGEQSIALPGRPFGATMLIAGLILGVAGILGFALVGTKQKDVASSPHPTVRPATPAKPRASASEAWRKADLDTPEALGQAIFELQSLPDAAEVRADISFFLSAQAESLLRAAQSFEREARKKENALGRWPLTGDSTPENSKGATVEGASLADIRALRQQARDYRKGAREHLDRASALLLQQSQTEAPDALEVLRARAGLALADDQPELMGQAMLALSALPEADTDAATHYLRAAQMFEAVGPDDGPANQAAIAELKEALRIRPNMNRARILWSRLLIRKGNDAEARPLIDEVLRTAPTHPAALAFQKQLEPTPPEMLTRPEATQAAQASTESPVPSETKNPAPTATPDYAQLLQTADRLRRSDRAERAASLYGKASVIRPESHKPYLGLGWSFLDLDQPKRAVGAFTKALQLFGSDSQAYYGLAESYRRLGNRDRAVAYYRQFLKRTPSDSLEARAAERQLADLTQTTP
jgi:predicted Zn finger-like uncharacterized protein